jgi:hypothetical protein
MRLERVGLLKKPDSGVDCGVACSGEAEGRKRYVEGLRKISPTRYCGLREDAALSERRRRNFAVVKRSDEKYYEISRLCLVKFPAIRRMRFGLFWSF